MSQILRRFDAHRERLEDARRLGKILLETGEAAPPAPRAGVTAGGDETRLRGLPAVAKGAPGRIPGTDPVAALLAKERRRRA